MLVEIAAGATNAEIAGRLYMAEGTVKTHITRLLAKLQTRDRVGLVLFAYETGPRPPLTPPGRGGWAPPSGASRGSSPRTSSRIRQVSVPAVPAGG